MKAFMIFAIAALSVATPAQLLRFRFVSDPGDYIGGGQTRDIYYNSTNTVFLDAQLAKWGPNGPDYVTIAAMLNPISTDYLHAQIGTNQLGLPLQTGVYENAMRAPFANPGHPGLDISFQHRGSNTLTGRFEILEVSYTELSPTTFWLDRLRMTFEQHSEGAPPAMRGYISYAAVPEPGTMALLGLGTGFVCMRRKRFAPGVRP